MQSERVSDRTDTGGRIHKVSSVLIFADGEAQQNPGNPGTRFAYSRTVAHHLWPQQLNSLNKAMIQWANAHSVCVCVCVCVCACACVPIPASSRRTRADHFLCFYTQCVHTAGGFAEAVLVKRRAPGGLATGSRVGPRASAGSRLRFGGLSGAAPRLDKLRRASAPRGCPIRHRGVCVVSLGVFAGGLRSSATGPASDISPCDTFGALRFLIINFLKSCSTVLTSSVELASRALRGLWDVWA